ncbi:MAG: cobalt-precorrin-6A reductase [Planktomarina sp.]|jgi:precorrin-6A/cobalt-precorrin-6A reductase|nr:cobalt-precorrin-6A reductase [Planktomarina sp.]MDG1746086.1 cobalt-precorrin-6A reductase [Planktomarina sp.]
MTVLILAGTGEARQFAQFCADHKIAACASLAGATRQPKQLAVPTYHGGFGGGDGFRAFLKRHGVRAICDATHPFAHHITQRSYDIARAIGLPYMRFERPAWQPGPGDQWIFLGDETEAAAHIAAGAVVFLATGRQSLPKFANLGHAQLICRQIDPPQAAFPWPNGDYLIGRPPFSIADEEALFRRLNVDVLVVKNAGGAASRTKLDAARNLGLKVLMIERPPCAARPCLSEGSQAEAWLAQWAS